MAIQESEHKNISSDQESNNNPKPLAGFTKNIRTSIYSRRAFLSMLALGAATAAFSSDISITHAANLGRKSLSEPTNSSVDELAKSLSAEASVNFAKANSEEGNKATWIDYAGAALFSKAVYELFPKGRGHIGATEYAALAGLIFTKYQLGDEETKHHVVDELKASLNALAIISGCSAAAQGLKIDVERSYEAKYEKAAKIEDKIALVTMLSSVISPVATTVSAAAALTEESQGIAREVWKLKNNSENASEKDLDHPTVAALIDHVANSSGFVLFGDPPWIAMMEKFGFKEAVNYQLATMFPLTLTSLISVNTKINERVIEAEGGRSTLEVKKEAIRRSIEAVGRNLPFLTEICSKSLLNTLKYVSGADSLMKDINQDPQGFELSLGKVFKEKFLNVSKMLANNQDFKFPLHDSSAFDGVTFEHIPELEAEESFLGSTIESMNLGDPKVVHQEVSSFLEHEDYSGLKDWLIENNAESAIFLVEVLKKISHDKADSFISSSRSGFSQVAENLLPGVIGSFYKRISSHRLHNAVGPQLSDVLNVFPFQAGSVIFLSPIFQGAFSAMRANLESDTGDLSLEKDIALDFATYNAVLGFSTIADNYVAAKLGLELDPKKAHLVLAAAIRGGVNLSPLSNMADPTLFPMHLYGIADSAKQMWRAADQHILGFVWSEVIDKILIPMGILKVPAKIQ